MAKNTWLRDHFLDFVIPHLTGLTREKLAGMAPDKSEKYPEMGLLKTAMKATHKKDAWPTTWSTGIRGCTCSSCASGRHSSVPTLLKNSVLALKREGLPILLTGRDCWPWWVMAQRLGMAQDMILDTRVSRRSMEYASACREVTKDWPTEAIFFDTGFSGSIYQKFLGSGVGKEWRCVLFSRDSGAINLYITAQWPALKDSRAKALFLEEKTPKYWESGRTYGYGIKQDESPREVFLRAALFTCWIWYSPLKRHVET